MAKIVISEFMDTGAVGNLWTAFDVVYEPDLVDRPDDLAHAVKGADALVVRNRTQVTDALLQGAAKLKCVGRLGVGLDNIDQDACSKRGVAVFPAVGANNLSVAEYVLTTAMMLLRNAYLAKDDMLAGSWPRQQCSGGELAGSTLGLVGFGGIAQLTAEMASHLGVKTVAFDPFLPSDNPAWKNVEQCELPTLFEHSDIISLHTPLTNETHHLIDAKAFAAMKYAAVLINAARGGVVDEDALVDALRQGDIAGAALDVFEDEPLTELSAAKFKELKNIVLTPHIAGVTSQSNSRVSAMIAKKIAAHLNAASKAGRIT